MGMGLSGIGAVRKEILVSTSSNGEPSLNNHLLKGLMIDEFKWVLIRENH